MKIPYTAVDIAAEIERDTQRLTELIDEDKTQKDMVQFIQENRADLGVNEARRFFHRTRNNNVQTLQAKLLVNVANLCLSLQRGE